MVYIISPTAVATGGTELLQQLCSCLNKNNICAQMYYTEKYDNSPVKWKFEEQYQNPCAESIMDLRENSIVIPEILFDEYSSCFRNAKVYFWWLSVDNFTTRINIEKHMCIVESIPFVARLFYKFFQRRYDDWYMRSQLKKNLRERGKIWGRGG